MVCWRYDPIDFISSAEFVCQPQFFWLLRALGSARGLAPLFNRDGLGQLTCHAIVN